MPVFLLLIRPSLKICWFTVCQQNQNASTPMQYTVIFHGCKNDNFQTKNCNFLVHLSRRLKGELIVYRSIRRPLVRPLVRPLTFSNSNISATSGPIITKFYLKHHWGGGLIALGFGPGRIGTLVSMATDSSHRVIMGKMLCPL